MARQIPLTRGFVAIVDDDDFALLSGRKWTASVDRGRVYARSYSWCPTRRRAVSVALHRAITNAPPGLVVDHINGDTLDNRRENLRVCKQAENSRNRRRSPGRSGFKGVAKLRSRWVAAVWRDYKRIHLGVFSTAEEAARAYDAAARRLHGEFAHLNFPEAQHV